MMKQAHAPLCETKEKIHAGRSAGSLPVVLVHGILRGKGIMTSMVKYFRKRNREAHAIDLVPNLGQLGLDVLATQVKRFVDETFAPDQKIDLVGFSMGGLVSRYYLQRLAGLERVNRFVTISSPHQGTQMAYLLSNPGGQQMRPGSSFLRDLATDAHRLAPTRFTSLWTPMDLIILPATSSVIPEARCKKILCVAHPLMVRDPRSLRAVSEALE